VAEGRLLAGVGAPERLAGLGVEREH
jgi:hypothetical protein